MKRVSLTLLRTAPGKRIAAWLLPLTLAVVGVARQHAAAAENYIPGAFDSTPSLPLYLNDPDMYYPDAWGGLCWASANADIFAYWDRNAYNGVKYWNLVDNGTAPLREPSLPTAPGHEQGDVKSVVAWLAHQYYGLEREDEAAILSEFANTLNGLSFAASYHGPAGTTATKTTLFNTIKTEIDAGRPFSAGSWGNYFGGPHQVPVMGYKEMSNIADSTIYIHRNTGGTQSEYVNFFSSSWGNIDINKIVPGGTPTDHYEAMGDNTAATAVAIEPDHVYNFRQTHNFSFAGDTDWISLTAVTDREYTIATLNLGASCDTLLQLYASNGTTLLAQDDDGGDETGASRIVWDSDVTGTVYIRVTEKFYRSGNAANYDVQVSHDGVVTPGVIDLQNGVAVADIAGEHGSADKEYRLTVPAGAASLQIAISGGSGDCDLYVRYGARATTSAYDYRPYLYGNNETVTVSSPTAGDWYIMLHGYSAYSGVTLLASYTYPNYTVTTVSSPVVGGVTGGGGSYAAGSQCTVTAAANAGYSFANWTDSDTVVSFASSYTFTVSGSRTLTANFTGNQYTAAFDAQGGTVNPGIKTVTFGTAYGVLPEPARTGYTFGGWWTGAGGAGAQVTAATLVATASDHALYAKWTAIAYTVTYNGNGSTGGSTPDSAHTYDVLRALSSNGYIRSGHVFGGWAVSSGGEAIYIGGQSIVNLAAAQGATVTLYAVWVSLGANLVLPANGGVLESFTSQYNTTTYKAANLADGSAANIWRSAILPGAQTFEYSFTNSQAAILNGLTLINVAGIYASRNFELWILPPGGQWAKVLAGLLAKSNEPQAFLLDGILAARARLVVANGYSSIYRELAEFELYGSLNAPTRPVDKWYAERGFEPAPGETWEDLDMRLVPDKNTTLWQEYVADTDPNDPSSVFRVTGLNLGPPASVGFDPASTQRVYRLQYTDDLASGVWTDAGDAPRLGAGAGDALTDIAGQAPPASGRRFYRVQVNLPE